MVSWQRQHKKMEETRQTEKLRDYILKDKRNSRQLPIMQETYISFIVITYVSLLKVLYIVNSKLIK